MFGPNNKGAQDKMDASNETKRNEAKHYLGVENKFVRKVFLIESVKI